MRPTPSIARMPGAPDPDATHHTDPKQEHDMAKKGHGLSNEEIAQREADSERVQDGVDKVKAGIRDIRQGLFGGKKK